MALISRLSIGMVFWQSGQTKVDGWHVTDNAVYLFQTEYKLPLVDPWIAAHMAAFAEHFFPLLLWIGFASRLSALAMLLNTFSTRLARISDKVNAADKELLGADEDAARAISVRLAFLHRRSILLECGPEP